MRLWEQFDRMVVFDTETTGIECTKDRIIELGAVSLSASGELDEMDDLVLLPSGQTLPPAIVDLTGITDAQIAAEGVEAETAAKHFERLLAGAERPLLVAYNAQFDLNFMYRLLAPAGCLPILQKSRFLDALTVYKDRRDYPHKLCNAIEAYALGDKVVNSHRAVDDARATVALLEAMAEEKDDLLAYIDLFGYNAKYGVSGKRISSVCYRPQSFRRVCPLYECT